MMRIAYFIHWDISTESGVIKKVASQLRIWREDGHEIRLFVLSHHPRIWSGLSELPVEMIFNGNPLTRFVQSERLVNRVLKWQPDIIYMRLCTYYPAFERMMRVVPTVLEINTDDLQEYRLTLPAWKYSVYATTRPRMLKSVSGLVAVSREIQTRNANFTGPVEVISNGIDFRDFKILPPNDHPTHNIFFIGHPWTEREIKTNWHGFDKLLDLAGKVPDIQLTIVGSPVNDHSAHTPSNVKMFPALSRQEYEILISRADAGAGTLALHRKGMNEASPLKVREYLAFGLPVIIGYDDTDFPGPCPFILNLDNIETNVDQNIGQIIDFLHAWKGKRVSRNEIAHLDVHVKERQRLLFFEHLLNRT